MFTQGVKETVKNLGNIFERENYEYNSYEIRYLDMNKVWCLANNLVEIFGEVLLVYFNY